MCIFDFMPELVPLIRTLTKVAMELDKIRVRNTNTALSLMLGNSPEDIAIYKKYKDLAKFISPLKYAISKLDPSVFQFLDAYKMEKFHGILEVISTPSRLVPLDDLIKFERLLYPILNCWMLRPLEETNDYVKCCVAYNASANTTANHTFYRSFKHCFDQTAIRKPEPIKRRSVEDEPIDIIPQALKMELAQLDRKFVISINKFIPINTTVPLTCRLEEEILPAVPPIDITVSEEYPLKSPICSFSKYDYSGTPFLLAVQKALTIRIAKLPRLYSLSHILNAWEMSVHEACSGNPKPTNDLESIFAMSD